MKKRGILILLVLSMMLMIGCKAEGQPQEEAPQATESNQVEESAPIESDEPEETTSPVEPMAITLRKPTQEELFDYFQLAYESGQLGTGDWEFKQLHILFDVDPEIEKPEDLDAQYLAWREANYPKEPEATKAPSSNPQTQPSTNNQAQPVSNQTGPGGATIVDDSGNPVTADNPGGDGSLETGGQRVDWSQVKTNEDYGAKRSDNSMIEYGGN